MLAQARAAAERGQFDAMRALCQRQLACAPDDLDTLLSVGALLSQTGFLGEAVELFERASVLAPNDGRARVNLANALREGGDHAQANALYRELLERLPDHPVVRRNLLIGLEYDPATKASDRLAQARAWGRWAVVRAGGPRPRPEFVPAVDRPLRVGYVSADFCQHTVGLFVYPVLCAHDPARVRLFAYSAGPVNDWVTRRVRAACGRAGGALCDVRALSDAALAERIRADRIDVLIDLSGHTAGSRLSVFAHRPAPVQLSWLGYFATTGLPEIDAILLDAWHAPPAMDAQFSERIERLPGGRFCYQPVPWAPASVAPPPSGQSGRITFGSFNNTAKLNAEVIDCWARLLAAVPDSRLLLKWRTFNDAALRERISAAFVRRGIAAERLELRGPSFHAEVLKEYADIDIALDPFPFTGGLTSCEALWMGVPVVTWPGERAVSRQSLALLSAIGLPELAARDADDYVSIAARLARDSRRLAAMRTNLRERMRASPLMDVAGFTRQLEDRLFAIAAAIGGE